MNPSQIFCLLLFLFLSPAKGQNPGTDTILDDMRDALRLDTTEPGQDEFLEERKRHGRLARLFEANSELFRMAQEIVAGTRAELRSVNRIHERAKRLLEDLIKSRDDADIRSRELDRISDDSDLNLNTIHEAFDRLADDPTVAQLENTARSCDTFRPFRTLDIIERLLDSRSRRARFYEDLEYDYKKVHAALSYIEGLIVSAGVVRATCQPVRPAFIAATPDRQRELAREEADRWAERIKRLSEKQEVREARRTQLGRAIADDKVYSKDIDEFMARNSHLDNNEFANRLMRTLQRKFDFENSVHFTVVTYSADVRGWAAHGMRVNDSNFDEGGVMRLRQNGRTAAVFWTHCRQRPLGAFRLDTDHAWGPRVLRAIKDCFPGHFTHWYFWRDLPFGMASDDNSFISESRPFFSINIAQPWRGILLSLADCSTAFHDPPRLTTQFNSFLGNVNNVCHTP